MANELSTEFIGLAQNMAENHVYLSVQHEDYPTASSHFLKTGSSYPPKIVVVVGAGASTDACGLPTGKDAANMLKSIFENDFNLDLIKREIRRITVEYRLEEQDFETVLLALSKFDQTKVLDLLNTIYNRRHYPSVAYEVLAHWMKHRFIDAIVNFNFDELLDQALDDELGPKGYHRVVTDGDCPEKLDDWLDSRNRFKFPLYIKPHGTASSKSTMRFTRSSYSLLPPDLDALLVKLFMGRTDVLIVGYAMQSVEFNDILQRSHDRSSGVRDSDENLRFYIFDHVAPKLNPEWKASFTDTKAEGLDQWFEKLSNGISDQFNPGLQPRTICRHKLITKVFHRYAVLNQDRDARDSDRKAYLRDRVYVEIALAVAKAKGFVSLEHLAGGRAGYYFRDLRRHAGADIPNDSMLSMCANLKLQPFGYWDTLCLPASQADASRDRLRCPILTKKEFEERITELVQATFDHLSADRQAKRLIRNELYEAFMEMYLGEEVEVSDDIGGITNDIFSRPTLLTTLTGFHAQTNKMIQHGAWDSILCAAETGQWLLRSEWSEGIRARGARLALVVADETFKKELQEKFGEQLGNRLRWMPWWLHNRHITVLLNGTQVVQAVYFERRLRTSHIVPMWLEGTDAEVAMNVFVGYWIKASHYKKRPKDIEIRFDHVQKERGRLIGELAKPIRSKSSKGNAAA
jgi:hypothetical protein